MQSLLGKSPFVAPLPSKRREFQSNNLFSKSTSSKNDVSTSLDLTIGTKLQITLKLYPTLNHPNRSQNEYSENCKSSGIPSEGQESESFISDGTGERLVNELTSVKYRNSGKLPSSLLHSNSTMFSISLLYRTAFGSILEISEKNPYFRIYSQVALGEHMLNTLFPDLVINLDFESRPNYKKSLTSEDVQKGFLPDSNNYTTICPFCVVDSVLKGKIKNQTKDYPRRFAAYLSIHSSRKGWQGSSGSGSQLLCEYLSPWVLWKEVTKILATDGLESFLHPNFRNSSSATCTIFWNLIAAFRQNDVPFEFSFRAFNFSNTH